MAQSTIQEIWRYCNSVTEMDDVERCGTLAVTVLSDTRQVSQRILGDDQGVSNENLEDGVQ